MRRTARVSGARRLADVRNWQFSGMARRPTHVRNQPGLPSRSHAIREAKTDKKPKA
jgi:hypothetical protein